MPSVVASEGAELPRVFIQRGERFLAMGKYPAAIANYSKVIQCCEGSAEAAEAHNDLGVIYARQGNMTRAVREYEAALGSAPYPLAHFNLGKAYAEAYFRSGAESSREKSLRHLAVFREYLLSAETFPPVVSSQRSALDAYLNATIRELSASRP